MAAALPAQEGQGWCSSLRIKNYVVSDGLRPPFEGSERCDGADPGVRMGIGLSLDLNLRLSLSGLSGASR